MMNDEKETFPELYKGNAGNLLQKQVYAGLTVCFELPVKISAGTFF